MVPEVGCTPSGPWPSTGRHGRRRRCRHREKHEIDFRVCPFLSVTEMEAAIYGPSVICDNRARACLSTLEACGGVGAGTALGVRGRRWRARREWRCFFLVLKRVKTVLDCRHVYSKVPSVGKSPSELASHFPRKCSPSQPFSNPWKLARGGIFASPPAAANYRLETSIFLISPFAFWSHHPTHTNTAHTQKSLTHPLGRAAPTTRRAHSWPPRCHG